MLPRGTRFGNFKASGHLGTGGFSEVYRAEDASGRTVAVKVLRVSGENLDDVKDRFTREKNILSAVSSRNVAKLIDADLDADQPWLASEYVAGETIKEYITRTGPIGVQQARAIVASLLSTLAELHDIGVVHRDLSPANIILGEQGPTIIDFGASRHDLEHIATGTIVTQGTPDYVSPEAEAGEPVGSPADIFALGRIIEFMITGDSPSGSSRVSDEDLQFLIDAASQRNPDDRPEAADLTKRIHRSPGTNIWSQLFTEREIRKLPRRIRPRTTAVLVFFTAIVVFFVSYMLLKVDEEKITVQSILGSADLTQEIDFSVNRTPAGVFSEVPFPDGYEGGRTEPHNLMHYTWVRNTLNGNTTYKYFDAYKFLKCDLDNCDVEGKFQLFEILVELQPSRVKFEMEEFLPVEKDDSLDVPPALGSLFDAYLAGYPDLSCGFVTADQMLALNPSRVLLLASQQVLQPDCDNPSTVALIYDQESGTVTSFHMNGIEPTLELFESIEFSEEPVIKLPSRAEISLKEFAGFPNDAAACLAVLFDGSCDQFDTETFRTYVRMEPESGFSLRVIEDIGPLYYEGRLDVGATAFIPLTSDDIEELGEDVEGIPFWDRPNFFPANATFPLGRWNIDEPEEHYFFNPWPDLSVVVLLEVTGLKLIGDKSNPIDYLVIKEQTSEDLDIYSDGGIWGTWSRTANALGEEWDPYLGSGSYPPVDLSDTAFVGMQFYYPNTYAEVISMDGVKIPFLSSGFPIIYGTNQQTTAVKTGSTLDYLDRFRNISRPDDPGLYMVLAQHFQAGLGTYSSLGGLDGSLESCEEILEWDRPLQRGSIEVYALTNCDIIPGGSGGGTLAAVQDTQAPIFEFIFKDQMGHPIIYGRFTPGGYFDILDFRDLLNEFVINEEAILAAKEFADPCSGMTIEEELELFFRVDEWFGNAWLENLPCPR